MRRVVGMIGLCWLLAAGASAQQPAALPLELRWQAPAECGSEADVRAQLERVAHALPGYALAPLRADATIDRQERLYALRLSTEHEGERGERKLEASDCPTLVRSMTLVLALAFGKGVELAETSGSSAQPAPESATPSGQTAPTAAPAKANAAPSATAPPSAAQPEAKPADDAGFEQVELSARPPLRLRALLGAGAQLALLPETVLSLGFGAEVSGLHWSAALRGNGWTASDKQLTPELAARFGGLGGMAQGCGHGAPAFFDLALCATAIGAGVHGRAQGTLKDERTWAPWLALGMLASATIPDRFPLALRLEASVAFSLTRPRFVIDGYGPAYRVPLVTAQLGIAFLLGP